MLGTTAWYEMYLKVQSCLDRTKCIEWPYALNHKGYPQLKYKGKQSLVTRLVLIELIGPPPDPSYHAAHKPIVCHNRKCINVLHLDWKTPKENNEDKWLDALAQM